jgi:hypothetical protein
MTEEQAEQAVRELLDQIDKHKLRDIHIPHGFEVESIEGVEESNVFATSLRHWRVTSVLKVPVIYSYTTGRNAHLPAKTDNLDALNAAIETLADRSLAHMHVMGWKVEPEEPRDPEDEEDGATADESWTVSVELEVV